MRKVILLLLVVSVMGLHAKDPQAPVPPKNYEIFFRTDSAAIDPPYDELIAAHGRFLEKNQNVLVRIEGHADRRGSREYNLALGERRSQSVMRLLVENGANVENLAPVSFGEEIRVSRLGTAESMLKNRHVTLVYVFK